MIKTQINEKRCARTEMAHRLSLPACCPITANPRPGSEITISYQPAGHLLEVIALRAYIDSYQGGRGPVRSMEGMIQSIAQDCANSVWVSVCVTAELVLDPDQRMSVECRAYPNAG